MEKLRMISLKLVKETNTSFKRYLFEKISWKNRLIGITGARGVGKTTMVLQYIKENFGFSGDALYVTVDDLYFLNHSIVDLAEEFHNKGGKHLFLDEIHKYPGWAREIKNIHDYYHDLNIVFTGSSAIEIDKGVSDLSRRVLVYHMNGLSLREYISLISNNDFPILQVDMIIKDHVEISFELTGKIKPLRYFDGYLKKGYYPFFIEDEENYSLRLSQVINKVLETDLPSIEKIDYYAVNVIKKILGIISTSVPFKPNIIKLSQAVGVSKETLVKYLRLLEKASLVSLLYSSTKGISQLNKPEKIYLNNTNLMYILNDEFPNKGTLRETFFINQAGPLGNLEYPGQGDFLFDGKYIFEVGGKTKNKSQIRDLPNAFVVADDIETGVGNKIPLWLFGFLY